MKKPLVALVGRPNVGKSTFFNKVAGRRISIVKDEPGVTRDRIYADAEWLNYKFTMVDTGGIDFNNNSDVQKSILTQAKVAIDLADVIILFVDGREGLTSADKEVADYLRKSKKQIVLAVNKLDNNEEHLTYDFYELGIGEPYGISAEQSKGIGDILDVVVSKFKNVVTEDENEDAIKIAIVGKPNAGKSSITNRLLGEERVVVSSVAGTTRDAIDTPFTYDGKRYIVIDTAGLRRQRGVELESVDSYSVIRTMEAIRRADVVLIVFDASEELSEQDVRIAGFVHEEQKPSVIVMNKWDLVEKDDYTINKFNELLREELSYMNYLIPVFSSAKTGQRFNKIMPAVIKAYENASKHVSTSIINEILQDAVRMTQPPSKNGKRLKFYFGSQVSTCPPTIVLQTNDERIVHFSYARYLENCFRKSIDFSGTPIKLIFRTKNKKDDM